MGISVHLLIGFQAWEKADWLLEEFREEALACCESCTSDWLRRKGDLLVESRNPKGAQEYLAQALEVLGRCESPIAGHGGNREVFALLKPGPGT